jgi:hypothetical protein
MNERPRPRHRLRHLALGLCSLAMLAGCVSSGAASEGPSASAAAPAGSASPSSTTAPSQPSATAPSPSATPGEASATPAACTLPVPGPLASDTLVDATLERTASGARLVFTFGARPPDAVAQPTIAIVFDEPPFSMAGSGAPVSVQGQRFLKVRMGGMVVSHPNGSPVYEGQSNLRLAGATIPQAVLVDDFEGVVSWIVGLNGPGCPTVRRDTSGGERLIVELAA